MIFFRADGNANIGLGHIMRCLSIADAAGARGLSCLFATADPGALRLIRDRGHEAVSLGSDYRRMDEELPRMLQMLEQYMPSALFIDSYYVSDGYLADLRRLCGSMGCKLVYLDDVLAFPYACDILIDYNIYAPEKESDYRALYAKAGMECPELLLGTRYAPLRRAFQNLPERRVAEAARDILISTGGADAAHLALRLAERIGGADAMPYRFHIVAGALNPDVEGIRALAEASPNLMLYENVADMQGLMSRMDAAISAAGSTLYELCATQTPAVTYIAADNQLLGAESFERSGILKCAGDVRELGAERLAEALLREILRLAEDLDTRRAIARRQRALVDGAGAERIVDSLDNMDGVC